jgi:hypothetical protein
MLDVKADRWESRAGWRPSVSPYRLGRGREPALCPVGASRRAPTLSGRPQESLCDEARRETYLTSLKRASVDDGIVLFTQFLGLLL